MVLSSWVVAAMLVAAPALADAPFFSKSFDPATIGVGNVSTLTFTISTVGENSPAPAQDLTFYDNLPIDVTIATPAVATSTCGGTVSAIDGGSTISFTGGSLGINAECQVTVNVTSPLAGTWYNVSGDLTSDQGNSGTASASLAVSAIRPVFTKSFAPATVTVGHLSRLTLTIDDSDAGTVTGLLFQDDLPPGLTVASPANLVNTCNGTATATSGTSVVSLLGGFTLPNSSCSVSVDVVPTVGGTFDNVTGDLSSSAGTAGKASAILKVPVGFLNKTFLDDPVAPGGTVTLEFTMVNLDRSNPATNITFTDDLDATLSGLVATGLPASDVCGAGSSLSGTSVLTFSGGSLGPGESCTFDVTLQVPGGAAVGTYTNTTSTVSADLGGSLVSYPAASDGLIVQHVPLFSKTFLDNPVFPGDTTTLEFSITNTDSTSSATGLTFTDDLSSMLGGLTTADIGLPASGFCGGGSTIVKGIGGVFPGDDVGILVQDASLPAGDSCTFDVTVHVPTGTSPGTYANSTSFLTGTVGPDAVQAHPATDDLVVLGPPKLTKAFLSPTLPGGTTTLQFTLSYGDSAPFGATGISFTDDLDATLSGLVATGLPASDVCGAGSSLSGTSLLTLTGGSLGPGASCTFDVTVQVPVAAPPGAYTNTTSSVSATVDGLAATGAPASADLIVAGLQLTKSFIDDPVVTGGTVTLQFTLTNASPTASVTNATFTDNLGAVLSGLTPTGLPMSDICGAGSQLSAAGSILTLSGGTLTPATSCVFSVLVSVPAAAAPGEYVNKTSSVSADFDGNPVTTTPATDTLTVDLPLSITKSFLPSAAISGSTVTLEFTIANADPSQATTGLTFTDDLNAALTGLMATGTPMNAICGAGSTLSGTSVLTLTGGNLPAGGSCTFDVTLQVPSGVAAGTLAHNVTSNLTGTVGSVATSAPPATDTLAVQSLGFSKSFAAPTGPGGTAVLSFTIQNLSSTASVSGLSFTDDLNAVIPGLVAIDTPQTDVCGAGSQISGTSLLTFVSGSLGPSASCSFSVTVQVPAAAAPGNYPNTTSNLSVQGLVAAAPATATLDLEPLPGFTKAFAPTSITQGQTSTLTITIDNTGSATDATGLDFTDNLPSGMVVANPANESTTCTGGTIAANPGSGTVSYSGGTVGAGAKCSVQVDVLVTGAGNLVNTSGALTSSLGTSGAAASTLAVTASVLLIPTLSTLALVLLAGLLLLAAAWLLRR